VVFKVPGTDQVGTNGQEQVLQNFEEVLRSQLLEWRENLTTGLDNHSHTTIRCSRYFIVLSYPSLFLRENIFATAGRCGKGEIHPLAGFLVKDPRQVFKHGLLPL
jgi:hypothetical protein